MSDITIIYITANFLKEEIAQRIRKELIRSADGIPIVSVSQKPIDLGTNVCVGDIGRNKLNIYWQILAGAKACETPYVAIAEDDVLYPPEHFRAFRPPLDTFAYNMNRWSVYTWKDPVYALKQRKTNTNLIAPRQQLIAAMEERFARLPKMTQRQKELWAEFGRYERKIGVPVQKHTHFTGYQPLVVFSHEMALGFAYLGKRKRLDSIRCFDLPYWGHAARVIQFFQ